MNKKILFSFIFILFSSTMFSQTWEYVDILSQSVIFVVKSSDGKYRLQVVEIKEDTSSTFNVKRYEKRLDDKYKLNSQYGEVLFQEFCLTDTNKKLVFVWLKKPDEDGNVLFVHMWDDLEDVPQKTTFLKLKKRTS